MRGLWTEGERRFVRGRCGRDATSVALLLHRSLPLCLYHILLFLEVRRAQWGFLLDHRWPLSLLLILLLSGRLRYIVVVSLVAKSAHHVHKVLLDTVLGVF